MLERNNFVPMSSFQAEQQARIERNLVIQACVHSTIRRLAEWLRTLGVWSLRLARDLAVKRFLRSTIRELPQLDDRTLAAIGVTRAEIESAVRNGLPTRVTHKLRQHDWNGAPIQQRTAWLSGRRPMVWRGTGP